MYVLINLYCQFTCKYTRYPWINSYCTRFICVDSYCTTYLCVNTNMILSTFYLCISKYIYIVYYLINYKLLIRSLADGTETSQDFLTTAVTRTYRNKTCLLIRMTSDSQGNILILFLIILLSLNIISFFFLLFFFSFYIYYLD